MDTAASSLAPRQLSRECAAFLAHWQSLRRDNALVPTLDTWLDHLPVWVASHKFRVELLPDDALVLFSGSALIARRGSNNTGDSLFSLDPSQRQGGLADLRTCVSQPCGVIFDLLFGTTAGRSLTTEGVVLPVAVAAGRWPQLVGFSVELSPRDTREYIASESRHCVAQWLDFGGGVPATAPRSTKI